MPIPTEGAWPPPEYAPAYSAYRDWDAWYSGSLPKLRDVYANRDASGVSIAPSQRIRSSQTSGGLVGVLSRWIWGRPPTPGQRDGRVHVPLPADLASAKAALLFSEAPKLTATNKAVQARLEQLEDDGLTRMLASAADAASALGDVYLRPVIDRDVFADRAILAPVHADGALPVIRFGHLIEVTFWQTMAQDGDAHFRLLEHHDVADGVGRIVHALHKGTHDKLGPQVPFSTLGATKYLDDPEHFTDGVQLTGLDRLDVVRIPNSEPQRLWRTTPALKHLGRSDFDGAEQWFDRLDEVWTSWLRDLHLARGRIIVPEYMLTSQGAGNGATWNADQEVFSGMTMMANQTAGAPPITPVQFQIRHESHKATADGIVEIAMRHAGLSAQTLGEEGGDVTMTATESQSRERLSFTTRGRMVQAYGPGIADAVELLLMVEAKHFGGTTVERPAVEFADSVTESPETVARTIQLLDAADAMSQYTKVKTLHPDWTEPEIKEELARLKGDKQAMTVQDPGSFTGAPPPAGGEVDPAADDAEPEDPEEP